MNTLWMWWTSDEKVVVHMEKMSEIDTSWKLDQTPNQVWAKKTYEKTSAKKRWTFHGDADGSEKKKNRMSLVSC